MSDTILKPNPHYQPARLDISYLYGFRTRRRGVKPSKYKRRLRYMHRRYASKMLDKYEQFFPIISEFHLATPSHLDNFILYSLQT